jgi:lipopolysaccharide export system protein LptC
MTMQTGAIPAQRFRIRSEAEREGAFVSAQRHSKLVAILRKALPVIAIVVFAGYFISSGLSVQEGGVTASIDGVQVKDGVLRMVNPKLKGADKGNGSYVIRADYADQDVKAPKILQLHAIKAELTNTSSGWSRVEAVRGTFDSDAQLLVMRENIAIATSSGVAGKLTRANLDTKNQMLRSHMPVAFDMPNGNVRANALTLHSADHTLVFRGNVCAHIEKAPQQAATASAAPVSAPTSAPVVHAPPGATGAAPGETTQAAPAIGTPVMPEMPQ